MDYEVKQGQFYKSLMAGLFTGIIATVANLAYNAIYREATDFPLSHLINVTTIIFVTILISMVAGILYYVIVPYLHKSKMLYLGLFIVMTILAVIIGYQFHRTSSPVLSNEFQGLFLGIVLITGLLSTFMIPYLARHKNQLF